MRHLRPAALVVAAIVVAATTACTPSPTSPTTVEQHRSTTQHAASRYDRCDPGYVCGTCPDGSSWAYLNDPQYTHDPQVSTLFFDDWRPCG